MKTSRLNIDILLIKSVGYTLKDFACLRDYNSLFTKQNSIKYM